MHGELDIVYDMLCTLEEAEGIKIDLLLCYGDFQVGDLSLVSPVPYSFDTALRERRQRHMIKNRESAAGSCARKLELVAPHFTMLLVVEMLSVFKDVEEAEAAACLEGIQQKQKP
ncbi:uncharacterized protein LOC120704320 isoform X5 [Panicum virgatum]|nr:uncharacterized protein LOC120704320 isoform X5 [Panicum virgatum]